MFPLVIIKKHTTASDPRPHILYTVQVNFHGRSNIVHRRYSEFVTLHKTLKDPFTLPPKRLLTTTFVPSAWADDALIAERKAGLAHYLSDILQTSEYLDSPALYQFVTLSGKPTHPTRGFDVEDALPSTLSRRKALALISKLPLPKNLSVTGALVAAAYYPDWSASQVPPESLDFSKFDILFFAFATPNSTSTLSWGSISQSILKRLVASATKSGKGTKIVLSVGGWGGSYWFSQACSTASNRAKFVAALVGAVQTLNLDGIDIDWEYPNSTGAGNPHSNSDAANLLSLFRALRAALGPSKLISAAVPHLPWLGPTGKPLTDVSEYAAQVDYLNIMNYDVWGSSSTPGPNAPLGNLCGTSKQPQASAQAALVQWQAAKFPASKLLLGLALYGYVSKSTQVVLSGNLMPTDDMVLLLQGESVQDGVDAATTPTTTTTTTANTTNTNTTNTTHTFLNAAHHRTKETPIAPASTANLQAQWGRQIAFGDVVKSGALVKRSDGNYGEGGGFTMGWDDCSDTPYLFNVSQQTVVTYDDTWSLADKAKFAKQNGMGGCFTWSLDQDDGYTLQNVIRANLGK